MILIAYKKDVRRWFEVLTCWKFESGKSNRNFQGVPLQEFGQNDFVELSNWPSRMTRLMGQDAVEPFRSLGMKARNMKQNRQRNMKRNVKSGKKIVSNCRTAVG